ncbi:hypothetical protein [Pseudarthrobacter sp. BRE9]|uniref:hypothetical protein n=1 Tax=Pseudarthrobacter sp. BRE9 TaxID=2962582 RepID=UPI002881EE59|nr:hypothetical protein [Pseudarthrobacter sp. BRE9]MDT0168454.1 hypothetical protein [Pseudarthrobacter sp. BRE9]
MVAGLWDAALGKVPDQWKIMAAPALVFWAGAFLAWASSGRSRLSEVTAWLNGQSTIVHIATGLAAVTLLAVSFLVTRRLTAPVLRILEGYWPAWLASVAARRRRKFLELKMADNDAWLKLMREWESRAHGQQANLDTEQRAEQAEIAAQIRAELAKLEQRRRHRPVLDGELLPTRLGNILRAAETRPNHRYGLDAVVIWPRLWLVLPDLVRSELTGSRAALDASVSVVVWGAGFLAFTPWAWWATPVGLSVSMAAILWWAPTKAEVFAELVESAYDLYRWEVYRYLCWPLPIAPADEPSSGRALTQYLTRGSDQPKPKFTHDTVSEED